jgi:hypothetical protein
MFRTVSLSIIRNLFTVNSAMVYVIQVCRQLWSRTRMELVPSWSVGWLTNIGYSGKVWVIPKDRISGPCLGPRLSFCPLTGLKTGLLLAFLLDEWSEQQEHSVALHLLYNTGLHEQPPFVRPSFGFTTKFFYGMQLSAPYPTPHHKNQASIFIWLQESVAPGLPQPLGAHFDCLLHYTSLQCSYSHSCSTHGLVSSKCNTQTLKKFAFSSKFIFHYTFPMAYNRHP